MSKQTEELDIDLNKEYTIEEAAELLPKLSTSNFVGKADLDIILKKSKKKNMEAIRGSVTFPHNFGEPPQIIVFGDDQTTKDAKDAGAKEAGLDDLIKKVENGDIDFDVVLATPDVMSKIAKLGRYLGPQGLMPNPNNGTITTDVTATIEAYLAGKQDFKMSDQNAIRGAVAKLDMDKKEIVANMQKYLSEVFDQAQKIHAINPFKQITASPTMGPGIKLNISSVLEEI